MSRVDVPGSDGGLRRCYGRGRHGSHPFGCLMKSLTISVTPLRCVQTIVVSTNVRKKIIPPWLGRQPRGPKELGAGLFPGALTACGESSVPVHPCDPRV